MDFRSAKYFSRLLQGFVVFGSGWKKMLGVNTARNF